MMRLWHSVVALCVGGLVSAADHGNQTDACVALAATFPGNVAYANSTSYIQSNNYWSQQQAQVHPQCFVTPRSTDDVSTIIKILTSRNAAFTVKGGGHVPFAGASNIADGVTIDLVYLNAIVVSDDRQTVSVGPGNRWINVSEALDPLNLAVVGGRAADVGVSGFVLGCGISYFSGFRGWACDNVRNFELVVASGDIVNASPTTNPDLYWALRGGGGSNFGVVTRFDLATFEQGDLWGNTVVFPGSLNTTLIPLFQQLNFEGLPSDTAAHTFFDLSFQPTLGQYVINANFFHATPPPSNSTPAVFAPFQSIPGAISNSTTVAKISTHFNNIKIPYGSRQTWSNTIVSATPQSLSLLADIVSLFEARNTPLLAASKEGTLTPFLVFQFIPVNLLSQMQKDGGNTYGLKASDGPFFILSLVTTWEEPNLDELIDKSTQQLIEKMESLAKERNLGTGHVFMNYAGREQQVQKRFGKNIDRKLKRISRTWDPRRKFAKLWTGFFKLDE